MDSIVSNSIEDSSIQTGKSLATKNSRTTVACQLRVIYQFFYDCTAPVRLLQVIGAIVVGLLANYSGYWPNYDFQAMLFLLLIATSCLIATGCLLISCLLSISTATIIAKTMFVSWPLPPPQIIFHIRHQSSNLN